MTITIEKVSNGYVISDEQGKSVAEHFYQLFDMLEQRFEPKLAQEKLPPTIDADTF